MTVQPQHQKDLFGSPPERWETDDGANQLVATVVFAGPLEGEFDYRVPDRLRAAVEVGRRVNVPLGRGNRPSEGYCVRLENRADSQRRLKELLGVLDARSLMSPAIIRLTKWIAERYLCGWGQVLEAVVPAGVRGQAGTRVAKLLTIPDEVRGRLETLKLPPKQAHALRVLIDSEQPMTLSDLARTARCTSAPIKALLEKGLLRTESHRTVARSRDDQVAVAPQANLELNGDQRRALAAIHETLHAGRHETFLLRGVTGSGKTEVYIQAIQEVVRFGRQAIVLVPEISLTPQTVERFRSRFPDVAVLHSHLSDSERHRHWQRIAAGHAQVVVGARSAIFAPTPHLGLIVLDEEHENSFKQETAPRYHARDVALERARAEKIPLVLGSATPSLETWQRALEGVFKLIDMPCRVLDRPMPAVRTIDLRQEAHRTFAGGALSRPLRIQMEQVLKDDGQVILLLNRRGFSTHIQCTKCGHAVRCPSCDIALTWHRHDDVAICHYCDHQIPTLKECPECHFAGIRYAGIGTQKLEAEVRASFRDYPCLRMDTDTMRAHGSHERALERFRSGEVRILLGTQMIAKGLDFPNVGLVGVVNADMALHLPDFRAAERTFQLLVQVAGRTGRGDRGGRVLVQTFSPDHLAIQAATRHDYAGFAKQELPMRLALGYPPFGSLIRLILRGPSLPQTKEFATHIAHEIRQAVAAKGAADVRILGPAPAPVAKLRDKYRYNLQLQGPDAAALRTIVAAATRPLKPPEGIEWIVDVDPISML